MEDVDPLWGGRGRQNEESAKRETHTLVIDEFA